MAWRRPGDRSLSELMVVSLLTHICVIRPQWVNYVQSMFHIKLEMFFYFKHLLRDPWIVYPNADIFGSDIRCSEFTTLDTCLHLCLITPNCLSCIHKLWGTCCLKYITTDEGHVVHAFGCDLYQLKDSSKGKDIVFLLLTLIDIELVPI